MILNFKQKPTYTNTPSMNKTFFKNYLFAPLALICFALISTNSFAITHFTGAKNRLFSEAQNWTNGVPSFNNDGIIAKGHLVVIDSDISIEGVVTNFGTLIFTDKAKVSGTFVNGGNAVFKQNLIIEGNVENFGDFDINAKAIVNKNAVVDNSGVLNIEGSVSLLGKVISKGAIDINYTASLDIDGKLLNSGQLNVEGSLSIQNSESIEHSKEGMLYIASEATFFDK